MSDSKEEGKERSFFVYKRHTIARDTSKIFPKIEVAMDLSVVILGRYGARISGINLEEKKVFTFHDHHFLPRGVVIGNTSVPIIKKVFEKERYHQYELVANTSSQIVEVSEELVPEDIVFQIGVRDTELRAVTVGTVQEKSRYLGESEEPRIVPDEESGSGIFDQRGRLVGMTLGLVAPDGVVVPDIMIATPVLKLLAIKSGVEN